MAEKHSVFVYGTLRQGAEATHKLDGWQMYAYNGGNFPFPYVMEKEGSSVVGNILVVDDDELAHLDKYENLRSGLYTREKLSVFDTANNGYMKAWVYVAGPALLPKEVDSGDWLSFSKRN